MNNNKIFIDSSLLVERAKGTRPELLNELMSNPERYELCINDIVLSEFTFYLLIIEGEKAPLTLKRDGSIPQLIAESNPTQFLETFTHLSTFQNIIPLYLRLMQQYNLLPNDALILATCLNNGIKTIASFDTDFKEACQNEDILLVSDMAQLVF